MNNSFVELIGNIPRDHNKKIVSKSLSYNVHQLRKIRAIYGTRVSFNFREKKDYEEDEHIEHHLSK